MSRRSATRNIEYRLQVIQGHTFLQPEIDTSQTYITLYIAVNCNQFRSTLSRFRLQDAFTIVSASSFSLVCRREVITVSVSKKSPLRFCGNFSKTVGTFSTIFYVPIMRAYFFIQFAATLTKLCHIKRDHPVHIMYAECPPSAETHAGIF